MTTATKRHTSEKKSNFLIKSISKKECNMIAQKQINSINTTSTFQTSINVNEHRFTAMIDSSATKNFMSQNLIERKYLFTRKKDDSYDLIIIDENSLFSENERVNTKTKSLSIAIQRHHEKLIFDIVRMITHDVVLKMSWLRKHNSTIDWKRKVLTFEKCNCVVAIQSAHRQRSMTNEKQNRESIAKREFAASSKNTLIAEIDFTDINTSQQNHKMKVIEKLDAFSEIFENVNTMRESSKHVSHIYKNWRHLFREEKTTIVLFKHQSWNHEIKLKSEKQFTFEFIYALFEKKLKILRKYLNENMKKEFIRKFESSTKYSIFFVFKKNDTFRLCVDYRKLNNITIKNRYSLFNISELQNRLQEVMHFIKFDLREAYNLIRMKADEKWKTVFRTRYEHYEYTMMSFELINVSTTCQEMINDALRQYLDIFVIVYLNDILIFFKIMKLHVNHVITVFKCLNDRDLRFKSKKCEFHKEKIDFLNFVVERNEIRIDSKKIRAIQNWKSFINVKKLQSFLEFINYNRKFIKNYFSKAISLINLTAKDKLWSWKKKKRDAFNKLQQACITDSVLKMFDTEKSIRLKIDASDLAIKTCISQKHDDKWHSIIYLSRKLSSAKQNYDIHDKKLLAIVIFLKQWRIYAEETSELIIFTNHKNLLHFITTKQFNKRQMRWSELLKQYKFTILYISRKKNDKTDALNRRNDYMKTKEIFNHNILKINKNESLSINRHKLNAILRILKDDKKQYSIEKERLHISNDKIDEIIKNHYDESLQSHSNVFKTLQLLR